jgi:hypothetical protein
MKTGILQGGEGEYTRRKSNLYRPNVELPIGQLPSSDPSRSAQIRGPFCLFATIN